MLDYITIEPKASANASIIWLHGLGADGHDFADIVPALQLPPTLPIRFIFPHAKPMPVTLNQGYVMPAWFDILDLTSEGRYDIAGIAKAVTHIEVLINAEISKGIAPERILLAGFSQGAALALMTGLHHPQQIAGVMALSGFLPPFALRQAQNIEPFPCLLVHGTQDTIVPIELGKMSVEALRAAHFPVTWHEYPMAHQLCVEEIADISAWIQQILLLDLS